MRTRVPRWRDIGPLDLLHFFTAWHPGMGSWETWGDYLDAWAAVRCDGGLARWEQSPVRQMRGLTLPFAEAAYQLVLSGTDPTEAGFGDMVRRAMTGGITDGGNDGDEWND